MWPVSTFRARRGRREMGRAVRASPRVRSRLGCRRRAVRLMSASGLAAARARASRRAARFGAGTSFCHSSWQRRQSAVLSKRWGFLGSSFSPLGSQVSDVQSVDQMALTLSGLSSGSVKSRSGGGRHGPAYHKRLSWERDDGWCTLPPLPGEVDRRVAARRWGRVAGAVDMTRLHPGFAVLPPLRRGRVTAASGRSSFSVC